MKLLICIVPPSMIDDTNRIIGSGRINYQTIVLGKGTAPSEILEYLALGETDRHVILATVEEDDLPAIYKQLIDELDFLKSGRGVAFTSPVGSISKLAYDSLISHALGEPSYGQSK